MSGQYVLSPFMKMGDNVRNDCLLRMEILKQPRKADCVVSSEEEGEVAFKIKNNF